VDHAETSVINVHDSVQGMYRSWKVMEFKSHIFQAWKVLESGLGSGKSWKVMEM